ncbi:MAG: SH3 domain-containing protein [Anaerolineales bacterium]|nr:SH3 domain-containing protein [Anaerolineales bacterium]
MTYKFKSTLLVLVALLLAACGGAAVEATPETIIVVVTATPEIVEEPVETDSTVEVRTIQDVNLRAGDGTAYGVVTIVPGNATVEVIGKNSSGSWLQVVYNGATGWISAPFTEGEVPADVPVVQAPPPPTGGGQAAQPTSTSAPAAGGGGGNAGGGGGNAGGGNDAGGNAGGAQVAPADSNISVSANIKNQSSTHTGEISYPEGDAQDRVVVNVSGFDSNTTSGELRFTLTCTGQGVANVKVTAISTNGGTPACNNTWTAFFTNVSTNHNITILLDSGAAAYVNWTLLITK